MYYVTCKLTDRHRNTQRAWQYVCGAVAGCTDTSDPRHFGPKTLRHQCRTVRETYRHWCRSVQTLRHLWYRSVWTHRHRLATNIKADTDFI